MGRVAVTFRVMPADSGVDVESLESSVRASLGSDLRDAAVKPVAFGLRAVEATVVVDDEAGAAERLERKLRGLSGAGEVETLSVTLL